jgi:predicted phage terminase large subunit-like protein
VSYTSLARLKPESIAPGTLKHRQAFPTSPKRAELILQIEAIRELARRSLLSFTKYTKEDFTADWFHYDLAKALDQFLVDVVDGKSPRLIVCAPPRHGKTELVSRRFPAYALGRYPDLTLIATSYGASLAADNNRDVQRIIDDDSYRELFPATQLSGEGIHGSAKYVRTSEAFEVVGQHGAYKNAGVLGPITGKGGHILILDDPIKDSADAHSETVRQSTWDWYTKTFYTRCEPGGGILIIMTRWHEDDVVGRLLQKMEKGGEQWKVLSFPAVAEVDEEHRKAGEALCPSRFPLEALKRIKDGTEDVDDVGLGSRAWSSLYQQAPSSKEGETFKRENWKYVKLDARMSVMEPRERRRYLATIGVTRLIQTWDTAIGSKKKNDFAACATMGILKNGYLCLDIWKDKVKYPEMRREIQIRYDAWLPDVVAVEGGGAGPGKAVVQDLHPESRIPLKETVTSKDKELRADMISPLQETGKCFLPEGAPWVATFVDTAAKFPSVKNDDDLDAWMLGIEEARTGRAPMRINDAVLARV